jgi:hypothetical protein
MIIAPGPHAWETAMRSTGVRASAQKFVDDELNAAGGMLSQYGQQLQILLEMPLT